VTGGFSIFFLIPPGLTPLAGVAPSHEHGIRRQHFPLCASFDVVHHDGMTFGQGASERGLGEEKSKKCPRSQGSRSTAHPGLKTTPLRGLVPALPREAGEERSLFFQ